MAKIRSIKLAENADGTFSVLSYTNTAQLTIGQRVTRERLTYWAGLPDVRTAVVPAPREDSDDLSEENSPDVSRVIVESEFEIQTPQETGTQHDAREFDKTMLEHALERGWANESQFAEATLPCPGNDHIGTMGIKAKVRISDALAAIRRNCVRDLNGDVANAGELYVRAGLLSVLKNLVSVPLPF